MAFDVESSKSTARPVQCKVHGASTDTRGPEPDLEKIQAILEMSELEDVTALRQFLGMVTYLGKFMPHLSDMTEPLRRMENNDVEFQWLEQHSKAVSTIKKFLTKAPVLHYDDVIMNQTQYSRMQASLGSGQPFYKTASSFVMLPVPSEPLKCITCKLRKRCYPTCGHATNTINTFMGGIQ